jgi:ABC-type transport system involved in multi-copper enzyme maturation permease subunit
MTSFARPTNVAVLRANVRAEWTKMRTVRSTMWTLLAALGLTIGFGTLIAATQVNAWDKLDPAERLRFDPTSFSLAGLFLAQMAVGVLGVLLISSEYATGQIRATLAATPQRTTVLVAKAATFIVVVLVVGTVASFGAFAIGQSILSAKSIGASLSDPGVLRAVIGGGLYLTAVGVLGLGVGTIVRRTAGAVATLVGLLVIVPLVTSFLPSAWNETVAKFFPAQAGMAVTQVVPDPAALAPWAGFAVLVGYALLAMAVGGWLLVHRDA